MKKGMTREDVLKQRALRNGSKEVKLDEDIFQEVCKILREERLKANIKIKKVKKNGKRTKSDSK